MRKKLLLILTIFVMQISILPAMPVHAVSDELLILAPNFNGADTVVKRSSNLGQWTIVKPPYSTTSLNGFNDGILYRAFATPGTTPASIQIYVPSDNTYRIYMRIKDFKEISSRSVYMKIDNGPIMVFGSRPDISVAPDGIEANKNPLPDGMSVDTLPTVSAGGVFYWDGAENHHTPVTLTKGFHTVTINNPTSGSPRTDAIIFKTEGEAFSNPSSFNPYLEGLKDIDAPVFTGGLVSDLIADNSISFNWNATDTKTGITSYEIYRNNNLITVLQADTANYLDNNLSEGQTYDYKVRAIDRLGQYSEETASFSTTGTPDIEMPTWPLGANITVNSVGTQSANISWTSAIDNKAINEYNIYKNSIAIENLIMSVAGSVTTAEVTNLPTGTTTKLLITAKDSASLISENSINIDVTTRSEVKYLLRTENFSMPTPVGGWVKDLLTTTNGVNSIPGDIYRNTSVVGEQPIEANIYIPDNDSYHVWALGRDYSVSSPGSRWFSIGIDDNFDSFRFASQGIEGWSWDKGFKRDLTAGWHKIGIKPGGGHMRVSAVLITNDASLVLDSSVNANYLTQLAPLEDKVSPVIGSLSAVSNTNESIDINWTTATDIGKGVKGYKIYANNSTQPIAVLNQTVNSYRIEGLNATASYNIKLEALDTYGNKSNTSLDKKVSYFNISKFQIADASGVQANNLSALSAGGKATAIVSLTNQSDSGKPILLGIAIYEKSTGRMVASDRKAANISVGTTLNDFKVEVSLPTGFASSPESYSIYTALWDDIVNMTPQEEGKSLQN